MRRSNDSPVATTAFSQKLSCNPQTNTASTGGSHAVFMLSKENSLRSICRCSRVRSCGSKATERASNASAAEEQTAESRFKETSCQPAGSQRTGRVTR
jgi:hypothetical protein